MAIIHHMMKNAVEVRDLVVRRGGREVLKGIGFTIEQGSVTGLLGPSGCGKSTLMRSLVGVQQLTSGTVTAFGEVAGGKALRHRIGYVTQAASVYDDLSVTENLKFFAQVLGVDQTRIDEAIDAVDLRTHKDAVVGQLSGGQRAGPASPSRSSASPTCSCSTSRPSAWTPSCAGISGSSSTRSPTAAPPSSSPAT